MSKCENSKPGRPGYGIPPCNDGEACVTLEVSWRKEVDRVELCLPCTQAFEVYSAEHDRFSKRVVVRPVVGLPATVQVGSDRYPYTVVSVKGKTIVIQRDNFVAAEGHNHQGAQKYTYSPNPEGRLETWTLRRDGFWRLQKSQTGCLTLGVRRAYLDPHV